MTALFITVPLLTVPVTAALLFAFLFARSDRSRARLRKILAGSACVGLVLCAAWSWALRDLFATFAIPSTGALAYQRFLELFWIPFALIGLILLIAAYPRRKLELYFG